MLMSSVSDSPSRSLCPPSSVWEDLCGSSSCCPVGSGGAAWRRSHRSSAQQVMAWTSSDQETQESSGSQRNHGWYLKNNDKLSEWTKCIQSTCFLLSLSQMYSTMVERIYFQKHVNCINPLRFLKRLKRHTQSKLHAVLGPFGWYAWCWSPLKGDTLRFLNSQNHCKSYWYWVIALWIH